MGSNGMRSSNIQRAILEVPTPRSPGDCVVENWLTFLGHRWNALIIWHLNTGPKQYGELATLLPGVSSKVLSERLLGLEKRALVVRNPASTFPRTVIYRLSETGSRIGAILDQFETL